MDQAHPLVSPMMGRSRTTEDPYNPYREEEEEEITHKDQCLTTIGALIYLTTHTRPDIAFTTIILTRHSQKPTTRHWNGIKHVMRYLRGTKDLGLHFKKSDTTKIVGYADSGFETNETIGKSQTGYIFLKNGSPILWKSVKQTVTATSTNHAELLAFHEAAREAVSLKTMEKTLDDQCKLNIGRKPTVIYEDNSS